jgi:hypothetical protein
MELHVRPACPPLRELNLPRLTRLRLPARVQRLLNVPAVAGRLWSMGYIHDTLHRGNYFHTLNAIAESVREALGVAADTSLPAPRFIRVLEQLKDSNPLPEQDRVDNGPEIIFSKLVAWFEMDGARLHHIEPSKPIQNTYIERFNRSMRREALDAPLFANLRKAREILHRWMVSSNEKLPTHRSGSSRQGSSMATSHPNKNNQSRPKNQFSKCSKCSMRATERNRTNYNVKWPTTGGHINFGECLRIRSLRKGWKR